MAVGVGVVRQCAVMCWREVAVERDFFFSLILSILSFLLVVSTRISTSALQQQFCHGCLQLCVRFYSFITPMNVQSFGLSGRGASLPLTRLNDCSGNRTTSYSSFPVSWWFTNHGFFMKTSVIKSFEPTIQLDTYKRGLHTEGYKQQNQLYQTRKWLRSIISHGLMTLPLLILLYVMTTSSSYSRS